MEPFAGGEVMRKVMDGSETIASASGGKVANWVKVVMERLDSLVDE